MAKRNSKEVRSVRHLQKALNHTNKTLLRLSQLEADGVGIPHAAEATRAAWSAILDSANERGVTLDTGGLPA